LLARVSLKNTHISAHRQNFKNLVGNFYAVNMRSLYAKYQPIASKLREEFEVTADDIFFPLIPFT